MSVVTIDMIVVATIINLAICWKLCVSSDTTFLKESVTIQKSRQSAGKTCGLCRGNMKVQIIGYAIIAAWIVLFIYYEYLEYKART